MRRSQRIRANEDRRGKRLCSLSALMKSDYFNSQIVESGEEALYQAD